MRVRVARRREKRTDGIEGGEGSTEGGKEGGGEKEEKERDESS